MGQGSFYVGWLLFCPRRTQWMWAVPLPKKKRLKKTRKGKRKRKVRRMIWNSRVDSLCLPGLLCSVLLWSPLNESLDKSHLIILINEISRPNSLHTDRVNPRGESAQDNDFFYLYLFFFVSFLSIQLRITKRWVFEEVQLQQETVYDPKKIWMDGWITWH